MPKKLSPALKLLLGGRLDKVTIADDDVAMVRDLATRGTIVWVHRSRNPVDHLALAHLASKHGLPHAAYVGGLNVMALQTLPVALSRLRGGLASIRREEALLQRCVQAGFAAEVFLRRPLHLLSQSTAVRARFVEVLVRTQLEQERPIFLLPVFLALRQRPGHFEPTTLDAIFGSVEEPGLLRAVGRLFAAGDTARLEISEPIDLKAFLAESATTTATGTTTNGGADATAGRPLPAPVAAKKVRWTILHHLARLERVAHGPPMKSHRRLREEVLKDAKLQSAVQRAVDGGMTTAQANRRIEKNLDEIAARFDVDITRFLDRILRAIWARIYDAIIVDDADLQRVRQAARRGPLVIVPSHRSHIDYLVMSQVMMQHGMLPPHIAAGDNLSFFPLGPVLRRGGAFFLRRSFKGDALYGATFRAYVRRLFKEGLTQEFFIEGGRSRTGKTLPPKLGLLSMEVEAWLESREDDAMFVPAHIAYEKIVEANSYTKELGGAAKEKESATGLVKAAGVLGGRYGKVFVTFGEPISLKAHMAERHIDRDEAEDDPDAIRAATAALGHRIVYGINQCGVVTAMSLVCASLFGFRRKGLDEPTLLLGARMLLAHVHRSGGQRFEAGLGCTRGDDGAPVIDDDACDAAFLTALQKLVRDRLVHRADADGRTLYRVDDAAWLVLDVHKNHVLHHAVPEAIVATALSLSGAEPGQAVLRADVKRRARALSRLLKLEFIFQPGVPFDALFDRAVDNAAAVGFVSTRRDGAPHSSRDDGDDDDDDHITVAVGDLQRAAWRFSRNLIRGFVEGYGVVMRRLPEMVPAEGDCEQKVVVAQLLEAITAGVIAGDLRAPEAASKVLVENAMTLLVELEIVTVDGKSLTRGPAWDTALPPLRDVVLRAPVATEGLPPPSLGALA